ncbi:hypothetical protein EIP86_002051 [Pleurotus ostreatoroseus]|nr:hypothetical protein EIP86_002051 [Pleurotus ostreatoroseus]
MSDPSCSPSNGQIQEVRGEGLYYSNGDIVLSAARAAEKPQPNSETDAGTASTTPSSQATTVFFRVDRIILCRHSTVLDSLLTIPAQDNANEQYDGVVHVRMSDNADDLAMLLRAIYDIGSLPLNAYDPELPLNIMGVLKLANKYDVVVVRSAIVSCLTKAWPQTLEEYDRLELLIQDSIHQCCRSSHGMLHGFNVYKGFPEPASAVYLGIECRVPEILPAAFYRLALTDSTRSWDESGDKSSTLARYEYPAKWHLIRGNADALWRVLLVKGKLQRRRESGHGIQFTTLRTCKGSCNNAFGDLTGTGNDTDDFLNALKILEEVADNGELCVKCERVAFRKIRNERQNFWNELTRVFEIDALYQ